MERKQGLTAFINSDAELQENELHGTAVLLQDKKICMGWQWRNSVCISYRRHVSGIGLSCRGATLKMLYLPV